QRALEQQALERWRLQKEAQIEQMMREGVPLGAVAAALGSPETAERIALLEAATSGALSAGGGAVLALRRAGGDPSGLEGLRRMSGVNGDVAHSGAREIAGETLDKSEGAAETAQAVEELLAPFGAEPPSLVVVAVASAQVPGWPGGLDGLGRPARM